MIRFMSRFGAQLLLCLTLLAGCSQRTDEPSLHSESSSGPLAPFSYYSYLAFVNDRSVPLRQIVVTDGATTYRIGSVTVEELLADIIKTDPIRDIYNYVAPGISHKCSNGSYLIDEFRNEGVLQRLYSYSFGCCSDVNEPMLSSLYLAAGFEGYSYRSPLHVAIDVCDQSGSCFYADADHDLFIEGGIDRARATHPGVAHWLADDIVYKENGVVRPLAAEGEEILPLDFIVNPGDWIIYSAFPVTTGVLRVYPGEAADVPPETAEGIAFLDLSNHEVAKLDSCTEYEVRFPYVLLSAVAHELTLPASEAPEPVEIPAHGKYGLRFEICGATSPMVLELHFQYNRSIFPNADLATADGVSVLRMGTLPSPRTLLRPGPRDR